MKKDLYAVLGLTKDASEGAIKRAFREKAMETHPDRGGTSEEFHLVELAYHILSDPERKERYDHTGDAEEVAPDNMTAEVLKRLGGAFGNAMNGLISNNKKVTEHDIVALMKKELSEHAKKVSEKLAGLHDAKNSLTEVLKRLEDTAPLKMVHLAVEGQLNQVNQQIGKGQEDKDISDRALKCLESCSYHFDPKKEESIEELMTAATWFGGKVTFHKPPTGGF